jgi:hypothetical protein
VDTEHHLIVAHEVTNKGSDRSQLTNTATAAKEALGVDKLEAVLSVRAWSIASRDQAAMLPVSPSLNTV